MVRAQENKKRAHRQTIAKLRAPNIILLLP